MTIAVRMIGIRIGPHLSGGTEGAEETGSHRETEKSRKRITARWRVRWAAACIQIAPFVSVT